MKTLFQIKRLAVLSGIAMALIACERTNDSITTDIEQDDAQMEAILKDLDADADEVSYYKTSATDTVSEGLEITDASACEVLVSELADDNGYRVITIDWGEENCTSHSGREKRGKVIVTLTDDFRNDGAMRIITFEDFFIDDNQIEGTRTVTNSGENEAENPVHTLSAEITVTTADGSVITRSRDGQREWVAGHDTWALGDDQWEVTGTCSGIRADGVAYSRTIVEPLVFSHACRYVSSGLVEIASSDRETATIDFGDGSCDATATVDRGGESVEIDLSKRRRRWRK